MHGLGRDIAVSAPTGSGKTLIYALSVLRDCKTGGCRAWRCVWRDPRD